MQNKCDKHPERKPPVIHPTHGCLRCVLNQTKQSRTVVPSSELEKRRAQKQSSHLQVSAK